MTVTEEDHLEARALPEGWAEAILDDVGQWSTGGTPSRKIESYFGGQIPWVKSGDLRDGEVWSTEECITGSGLANSAAKLVPPGTVSLALYGATIGKLGLLRIEAATNQACANCVPNGSVIEGMFLFFFLQAQRDNLIAAGQGGAQPNLTNGIVRAWPVSLPPLAEQRRIVAKVEALLERVNGVRERLDRVPAILKRFRRSVLAAACDGRLGEGIEPELWSSTCVGDVCDRIEYGHTASAKKELPGPKFLRITDIQDDRVDWNTVPYCEIDERGLAKYRLLAGDIVFARTGATTGKSFLISKCPEHAVFASYLIRLRANRAKVDPRFLILFFQSPAYWEMISENVSGNAQPGCNASKLANLPLRLPPLQKQRAIANRATVLLEGARRLELRIAAASQSAHAVSPAILHRAFRGELVPTEAELARLEGREYEPASVLLGRIRAQREAAAAERPSRGRRGRKAKGAEGEVAANGRRRGRAKKTPADPKTPAQNEGPGLFDDGQAGGPARRKARRSAAGGEARAMPSGAFETDGVMAAFRSACWGAGEVPEDELLREVARRLGYQRLGSSIRETLRGHLRAAIRRGIVERVAGGRGDTLKGATPLISGYDDEALLAAIRSVLRKGEERDRDEVTRAVAAHLGFVRVTDAIADRMKAVYRVGVRRGVLGGERGTVWREE